MGFWDVVNDIGEAIEDGVEAVVEGVGQVADDALDVLSDGAKAIGLDGIAEGLDDLGDNIASGTGGDVEEEELGETEDPKELIRGEPAEISSTAQTLQKMATAIDSTGQALKQIDAAEWVGEGADAFNAVYDKQPKLWFDCADAFTSAAKAMEAWHNEVKTGQGKAADAIDKWKAADAEERRQKNWWNSLTGEQQAQTTLVDTWTSMRNEAREILRGARTQRDNGASIAVGAFSAATDKAPKEPPFTDRWIANISDMGGVLEHGALNFTSGLLTSFTGLVQFVRQVNPTDIYNMTHPAEYAAGLSDLATGLVVAVADPGATVSAILSDARKNPFEFMGALTGDALLTAATGGGGSAKVAVSALRKMKDAGRLLGIATTTPSVVEMMEDLLTPEEGFAIAERDVEPSETGGSPRH
ncbi:putative T7SS-secreted protein, partial [Nocardia brasiliensis]|uniref:putative T7SS-secreted protein n=1 Tax=Nocardia brasiliensis TaxID=37326 RepID=UPI0032AF9D3B